jgi:hypothetical protein
VRVIDSGVVVVGVTGVDSAVAVGRNAATETRKRLERSRRMLMLTELVVMIFPIVRSFL